MPLADSSSASFVASLDSYAKTALDLPNGINLSPKPSVVNQNSWSHLADSLRSPEYFSFSVLPMRVSLLQVAIRGRAICFKQMFLDCDSGRRRIAI
jgi:hypothetical protein